MSRRAGLGLAVVAIATLAATPLGAGHGAGALVPSYSAEHVKRMLDAGEAIVLLDVRSPLAYRAARLPGARSIPLGELAGRLGDVPRAGRLVLYGESIVDAHDALTVLGAHGYRNAGILEDGFGGWLRRGYPVER